MKGKLLGCAALCCMPLLTLAADEPSARGLVSAEMETQTGYWLRMQREGTHASPHLQSATPAERELAMQRWLESHTHPIPEFFDQKAGGELSE